MEILRRSVVVIICLFAPLYMSAQTLGTDEMAFSSSYKLETAGDYAKAILAIKEINGPESYETNLRLGWLNYLVKDYVSSKVHYEKCIQQMPYSIEAKFGLVYPLAALNSWDLVVSQYQNILKIDALNTTANYRLGLIYYNRKNYVEAIGYFEKVVNLYPFDYDSSLMLGWSKLLSGKANDAKLLFKKSLLIRPGDASANEGLAKIK